MNDSYFSDRELGPRPRLSEEISQNVWAGIIAAIRTRIDDGSFGFRYPLVCEDGPLAYGCNEQSLSMAVVAEIPDVQWPLDSYSLPSTPTVLDLLEFSHRIVAKPVKTQFHSYFGHHHLNFLPDEGRVEFRDEINRILARNGIAFELDTSGRVIRLVPSVVSEMLRSITPATGDSILDTLLEAAASRYLDPDPAKRQEALEKLWDAWERFKTIEPGGGKKQSSTQLLDKAAQEPNFRLALEKEAKELTEIGNKFRIRHSEISQIPLERAEHIDYLFQRLFAMIRMLLSATGRA